MRTVTLFAAFVGTVLLANWLVQHFGIIDVGFGLQAPAAVLAVGVAFTLRDLLHRAGGPGLVIAAIVVGAALSYIVAPAFALASGVAFLASELADLLVYTPLERRSWLAAVVASNTAGLLLDSVLFLWLAFGSLEFLAGQVVGKAWMTALAAVLILAHRRLRPALA
jgi:queuosine precursor transporter